jgi:5'-3' exonuclease
MGATGGGTRIKGVILCRDQYSWRNGIKESQESYKAGRKEGKRNKFNFKFFNEAVDDFCHDLNKEVGVNVIKLRKMEADDIVCIASRFFNAKDMNTVIVSSDADLLQLVNTGKDNRGSTIIYDARSKEQCFRIDEDFDGDPEPDINDIFNVNANDGSGLTSFVNTSSKLVDPSDVLLGKVILGDKSDNISPCYPGIGPVTYGKAKDYIWKRSKKVAVTGHKMSDLNTYLKFLLSDDGDRELKAICTELVSKSSVKLTPAVIEKCGAGIRSNITMIWLHPVIYKSLSEGLPELKESLGYLMEDLKSMSFAQFSQDRLGNRDSWEDTDYDMRVFYGDKSFR